MPNHIHLVLFFIENHDLPGFMRDFKKFTSRELRVHINRIGSYDLLEKLRYDKGKQKFKVWKQRYDAVIIRHNKVLYTKIQYIHQNPVKKSLIEIPEEMEVFKC